MAGTNNDYMVDGLKHIIATCLSLREVGFERVKVPHHRDLTLRTTRKAYIFQGAVHPYYHPAGEISLF